MENKTSNLEEVKEKIKKLYAKANSTDSTAEADTCFKMAQNLLLRYNLELSQIDFRTDAEKRAEIVEEAHFIRGEQKRHESTWVGMLYNRLGRHFMCQVWYMGVQNSGVDYDPGYVYIIGQPHNIEIMKFMVSQAIDKIRIIEASHWAKYTGDIKRNAFKRAFFEGAVIGLHHRMIEDEAEMKRAQGEAKNMYEVMVVNRNLVDEYLESKYAARQKEYDDWFNNLSEAEKKKALKDRKAITLKKERELSGQEARNIGFKAGKEIKLSQGIENQNSKDQLN